MNLHQVIERIADLIFSRRRGLLTAFVVLTAVFIYTGTLLRVDAGFNKMIPLQHEYMKVFSGYQKTFSGANRVLVAVMQKDGKEIYNPEFFATLKQVTDAVFFIPGVDRPTVTSLIIQACSAGLKGAIWRWSTRMLDHRCRLRAWATWVSKARNGTISRGPGLYSSRRYRSGSSQMRPRPFSK